jgi:LemA protein
MKFLIGIIILVVIVAIIGFVLVGIYNGLVKSKVQVEEAWSTITVQLKRRADLLPNLVNTVKAYAKHEEGVFQQVTEARASTINATAQGPEAAAAAEGQMQGALKSLFAVAEAYPQLQANQNFLHLQEEITDTEDKVMASRRFYNGSVRDFNTKIQQFPSSIIAKSFKFKEAEFFEVEDRRAIEEPPTVSF